MVFLLMQLSFVVLGVWLSPPFLASSGHQFMLCCLIPAPHRRDQTPSGRALAARPDHASTSPSSATTTAREREKCDGVAVRSTGYALSIFAHGVAFAGSQQTSSDSAGAHLLTNQCKFRRRLLRVQELALRDSEQGIP